MNEKNKNNNKKKLEVAPPGFELTWDQAQF